MVALTREAIAAIFQEHSYAVTEGNYGRPGDWADKVLALDVKLLSTPCVSEVYSWDVFTPDQVDPYWICCTRVGSHDEHEDSNTGATWKD